MCRFKLILSMQRKKLHCFNTSYVSVQDGLKKKTLILFISFNTSYVSVQVGCHLCLYRLLDVSIHPMCRFKMQNMPTVRRLEMFQYILCVGSSHTETERY